MVNLEDCFGDSPQFQLELQSTETGLRQLEGVLKHLCKAAKYSSESMQSLAIANDALARSLIELGSVEASLADKDTESSMIVGVASELAALEVHRTNLAMDLERIIITPLETIVRGDLATLKELRKRYERSGYEYIHNNAKYMSKKGNSKEENIFECAQQVAETRKEFHECSLDYVLKLRETWHKQLFTIENCVSQLTQRLSKQSHEECKSFSIVQSQIERLQEKANEHKSKFETECLTAYEEKIRILRKSLSLYNPIMAEKPMTPSDEGSMLRKSGYLYKKCSHTMRPFWSRRFFELRDDKLRYWRGDASEVIDIDMKLCAVKINENTERRFCFDVISPVRTFTLQAENEHDLYDWIDAISQCIKRGLAGSNINVNKVFATERPLTEDERRMIKGVNGNDKCMDCAKPNPDWACINYGTLVCIECSGAHRNRGVHKSRVRSLELDHFTEEQICLLLQLGNAKVSTILPQSYTTLEERYALTELEHINVLEAIEHGDILLVLKALIGNQTEQNKDDNDDDWLKKAIEFPEQTGTIALLLLWGKQATCEHLKYLLTSHEGSKYEKLAVQLLKKIGHLTDSEKSELQALGKARQMPYFTEFLEYMIDEDDIDEVPDIMDEPTANSHAQGSNEKEKSSVKKIKESIKHQLTKLKLSE